MLDIIHSILSLLNIFLVIVCIKLYYKPYTNNYFDKLKNFRSKFILSLIICPLYFIKTLISFILLLSFFTIISGIICFIIWLNITISNYRRLKKLLSEDNKTIYLSEKDVKGIK